MKVPVVIYVVIYTESLLGKIDACYNSQNKS